MITTEKKKDFMLNNISNKNSERKMNLKSLGINLHKAIKVQKINEHKNIIEEIQLIQVHKLSVHKKKNFLIKLLFPTHYSYEH